MRQKKKGKFFFKPFQLNLWRYIACFFSVIVLVHVISLSQGWIKVLKKIFFLLLQLWSSMDFSYLTLYRVII